MIWRFPQEYPRGRNQPQLLQGFFLPHYFILESEKIKDLKEFFNIYKEFEQFQIPKYCSKKIYYNAYKLDYFNYIKFQSSAHFRWKNIAGEADVSRLFESIDESRYQRRLLPKRRVASHSTTDFSIDYL